MHRTPLQLYLLAHPHSTAAQRLALELMPRFMEPPATGGLRLPVFFTPDRGDGLPPAWGSDQEIDLNASEHTIVLIIADSVMVRQFNEQTSAVFKAWKSFFDLGIEQAAPGAGPHYVFAVAIDEDGFKIADREHMVKLRKSAPVKSAEEDDKSYDGRIEAWVASQVDDLAIEITIRAIQLLDPTVQAEEGKPAPVRFFLSHAKKDLPTLETDSSEENVLDAVRAVKKFVQELPIRYWFDAQDIPPSAKFTQEIESGIRDCSIVLAFLTDHFSASDWCDGEVLDAKQLGVPILLVDALETGEALSLTSVGNVPSVHWSGTAEQKEASRIVSRAVRETLRFMLNRKMLSDSSKPGDIVLASAPEKLTLAWHASKKNPITFLYPDPPIKKRSLKILKSLRNDAAFTTPLTRLAAQPLPGHISAVAVSISNSGDLPEHGLDTLHQETLPDEIHLYLLLAGLQIAYGGALSGDFAKGSNFTLRLFNLVENYFELAKDVGGKLHPILNYAPWPLRLIYSDREYNLFW